jgi:hypothetical protein
MMTKKHLLIASLLILIAAIPATMLMSDEPQETRSRATASTTLTYTPNTTNTEPLVKNTGDTMALDIIVSPGNNLPSVIKLDMAYDATKFQPAQNAFEVNTTAFPTTIEGPAILDGRILISLSIGSDPTKAIQTPTKVGTLNLIAKAPTNGTPAQITFGQGTQVLSLSKSDEATENVLSAAQPSFVIIEGTASAMLASAEDATPSATLTPTLTPTPTVTVPTLTPTPTINPNTTTLSLNVFMHGIGNSGDNANPADSESSTKDPLHPSRAITVFIYNDQNVLAATKSGTLTYASSSGSFTGAIDIGTSLPQGDYTIRVKEDTHLRRIVPGIFHVAPLANIVLPILTLVAGDANNDNTLNIMDYNLLIGCYSDLLPAVSCTPENKILTDLNDNGQVNQFDYNLFLREITVQAGN